MTRASFVRGVVLRRIIVCRTKSGVVRYPRTCFGSNLFGEVGLLEGGDVCGVRGVSESRALAVGKLGGFYDWDMSARGDEVIVRLCVVILMSGSESDADPSKPSKIFRAERVMAPELGATLPKILLFPPPISRSVPRET